MFVSVHTFWAAQTLEHPGVTSIYCVTVHFFFYQVYYQLCVELRLHDTSAPGSICDASLLETLCDTSVLGTLCDKNVPGALCDASLLGTLCDTSM